MQHLETDTVSLSPCWGKEEQIVFVHVPLTIGTMVSHNSRVPAFEGNLISCAQDDGNGSMSSAPSS